ncbi:hypothetical protein [Microbulbifer marinus]|uniref:Uncharacterized protein n=1 Tax=Microbulbifer marinus TaxID=658218 RepID=A0A1H3VZ44_9GAMM|nr:hypothetical protein [Microbulbifer marinus]SDZ80010.1 hypothetical protein SAMN05216562_0405 [Microbulbifer marinus]
MNKTLVDDQDTECRSRRKRRRKFGVKLRTICGAVGLALISSVGMSPLAEAQPFPFELEGDIENDNDATFPGIDWADVLDNLGPGSVFVVDTNPDGTQFTQGGSKDEQEIANWRWKEGTPLDKNNITAGAATLVEYDGDKHIAFGGTRFSTDGNAQIGLWFLQDDVTNIAGGTFTGDHRENDLLLLINFIQGGTDPTIEAFLWKDDADDGQAGDQPGLVPLPLDFGTCDTSTAWLAAGDEACAIANAVLEEASDHDWEHLDKDGNVDLVPNIFAEGIINLSAFEIDGNGTTLADLCFSTFLIETRSSQSITARLFDFILGELESCGLEVTKQCEAANGGAVTNGQVSYTIFGTVTANGGTIFDINLDDTPPGDGVLDGDFDWFACDGDDLPTGPVLDTGELDSLNGKVCYLNSMTGSAVNGFNGGTNVISVTGAITDGGTDTLSAGPAMADCPTIPVNVVVVPDKSCTAAVKVDANQVVAEVTATGQVCNTGDVPVTQVKIFNNPAGNGDTDVVLVAEFATLDPGAENCVEYSTTYTPAVANDAEDNPTTCANEVFFKDVVTVEFFNPVTDETEEVETSAMCPFCFENCENEANGNGSP